jgi:hypothetical protein
VIDLGKHEFTMCVRNRVGAPKSLCALLRSPRTLTVRVDVPCAAPARTWMRWGGKSRSTSNAPCPFALCVTCSRGRQLSWRPPLASASRTHRQSSSASKVRRGRAGHECVG